ncbi:uncharacterized protein JCM15063_002044 [Sporobolomyces koalae]|uniref:uncharacterized protein n=1 Tax=Sporobolomyces koalae TaxID=500713 RepID=UPI0031811022
MESSSGKNTVVVYHSADLNVSIRGKIVSEPTSGESEGTTFELVSSADAVQIKHPQLVTITTKPDSQTLHSVNTGEALLTLETPLLPHPRSESNEEEDATGEAEPEPTATAAKRTVTLHAGFVSAARLDPSKIQSSPLFSQAFHILIDAPSFPEPHFDPASLAPPTPSFRATDHNSATFPGVLNSPTLQRALLSPLLSPQRRAASQGSDMSVPPLSLGLSRTSRTSFSADNRPLRSGAGSAQNPSGLLALIPALAPGQQTAGQSTVNSTSSPLVSAVPQTPPVSATDGASLASTLTSSISASAKKTAEDILALRRNHDAFVRRVKAELEVLEARIESARNGAGTVAGGGVVRGFGVPVVIKREGANRDQRDESESRERGRSVGRAAGRTESGDRAPPKSEVNERKTSPPSKTKDRDEDISLRMREMDQREEDERGRSRSRQRRRDEPYAGATGPRSKSRSKQIAEATEAAAMGAKERGKESSSSRERDYNRAESIPATTEDGEDDGDEDDRQRTEHALGAQRAQHAGNSGGATPSFVTSTSTKGLVAIPETEELSLARSESSRTSSLEGRNKARERVATAESEREEDAPFEMDEDVDVDFLELSSTRPIFQQQPPDYPSEQSDDMRSPPIAQGPSSTFRPGSFQRASSLSASFAALLSTTESQASQSQNRSQTHSEAVSPGTKSPAASSSAQRVERTTHTSAVEDVKAREAGISTTSSGGPPDRRDVRRGEQKIRDLLAIDTPSHRRALPRKDQGLQAQHPSTATSSDRNTKNENAGTDSHEGGDSDDDDHDDRDSSKTPPGSKFQVGSLPIPVAHQPSARAMSSWRPDPEREWALEREKRKTNKDGPTWIAGTPSSESPAPPSSRTPRSALPLEIGGPSSSQSSARPVGASSLAQSLRNAPFGSFSSRAEREQQVSGPGEQLHVPSEAGEDEDEADEEDDVFLPPHLVTAKSERKDERYLSRSVSRS